MEVYKRKCDDENVGLDEEHDTYFEDLIEQEFIHKVSVDLDVGKVARRLLRRFPKIGNPQDAIHVATTLLHNIDELHTYDREDMLGLNGQLVRLDQKKQKICKPPTHQLTPNPTCLKMTKKTKTQSQKYVVAARDLYCNENAATFKEDIGYC